MADIIQMRRGTSARWIEINPILADGEIGIESDTRKFKFGNGVNVWTDLFYSGGGGSGTVESISINDDDPLLADIDGNIHIENVARSSDLDAKMNIAKTIITDWTTYQSTGKVGGLGPNDVFVMGDAITHVDGTLNITITSFDVQSYETGHKFYKRWITRTLSTNNITEDTGWLENGSSSIENGSITSDKLETSVQNKIAVGNEDYVSVELNSDLNTSSGWVEIKGPIASIALTVLNQDETSTTNYAPSGTYVYTIRTRAINSTTISSATINSSTLTTLLGHMQTAGSDGSFFEVDIAVAGLPSGARIRARLTYTKYA